MKRNKIVPGKTKAQAMVEFAIALPLLMLLLFGILETGRFLFIYSTVVTASRQAARYGAATGEGISPGVARYGDCAGIRNAAQRVDFLNAFEDTDIVLFHDRGPGTPQTPYCNGIPVTSPPPATDTTSWRPVGATERLVVIIYGDYNPIVPRLVPFMVRRAENGNAIEATSARTILASVSIGMPPGGGGGGGTEVSSVTITDSPDNSVLGDTVTVTATVTGGSGTPTGTVTITGAGTNCTIGLLNGTGSCTVTFNSTGTKTLTGTYGGDSTYATSTDTEQHIVGNPTTTTITATPNQSLPGDTVTVSVTVTGGSTTPSGDVTISGADSNCTITLDLSGAGNCDVVFASGGVKTLTASYAGDSSHDPSTGTTTHQVLDTSTTTITSDTPDPSNVAGSVNVSVTVTGGATAPTGMVSISGADTNCTITLSGGAGSCSVVFNSAGSKTLTATYNGDGGHSASTDTESHEVQTDPVVSTTLTISSHTPNPSAPGETVAVTVTITGGSDTPTGTVTIMGADTNCTITLNNGTGSCNVVFSNAGTRTITAVYNGDATHSTSIITTSHQVVAANTTTITSHTPNPSTPGANVAVAVTVAGGSSTPTGTVSITGADTNCTITLNNGSGTCNVVFTSLGTRTLTATYNGDATHSTSTGTATHQVEAPTSGLQLQITPNPPTYSGASQWIEYSYQVTNTGNVNLDGLAITASRTDTSITCVSTSLTPGTSTTCSGSYQTTTTDAGAASFVNTATASASDGSTTVTSNTATATVSKVTATCAAPQQTITASADAWVNEDDPNSTVSSTTLTVTSRQNNRNARAYVNFTFPALPAGCVIQSAVLNLYAATPETGRTIQAWQVTSSWVESSITWNLQPSATNANAASVASGSAAGTRSWTVTSIVQNMYSNGNYHGFLIRDASEGGGGNGFTQVYNSRENTTNRPTLVITFGQAP